MSLKEIRIRVGEGFIWLLLCVLLAGCRSMEKNADRMQVSTVRTNYHGWTDAIVLNNGMVEAIIVPQLGRVMQFKFRGEASGPFWENRALDGKTVDPGAREWVNFGGDKSWPSPQGDWPKHTPRGWPPPIGFDSAPNEARIENGQVELLSPADPHYGIRVRRTIS